MKDERGRLLAKVAYLYYIEGKSQTLISQELDIYRTTVSRMLAKAQKEGIVTISIKDYDTNLFALEDYMKQKYGLKKLEIVSNQLDDSMEQRIDHIARAAAEMIRTTVRDKDMIGISWGASLSKTIDYIGTKSLENVVFSPLAGGPSHINTQYHVNTLIYRISRAFNGKGVFVNAMAIQESADLAQGIKRSKYFAETLASWSQLDVAIVGIGGNLDESDNSQWRDLLTEQDYQILHDQGAIGEVCCRFFDAEGRLLHEDLQNRAISITLDRLARIPKTIAIACGEHKAAAILAVLRKKYINHLVTDKQTALAILELDGDDRVINFK